jgi:uncharacterized damage-inducible protein DinB
MKKIKTEELIDSLQNDVRQLIQAAEFFWKVDRIKLNYPPAEGSWSVLQALEHLNMYNRHYLPVIEKEVSVIWSGRNAWFVPGMLGNYFTRMMLPASVMGATNKMKAPKGYRPELVQDATKVLEEFLAHQSKLLQLLELSRQQDLNSIRIPVSIAKMIKLKLGDTFRFLIAHEQRHMVQARNAVKALGIATDQFPVVVQAGAIAAAS